MHVLLNELSYLNGVQRLADGRFQVVVDGIINAIRFFKSVSPIQIIYWSSDSHIHQEGRKFVDNKSYKEFLGSVSREERGVLLALFSKLNHLDVVGEEALLEQRTRLKSSSVEPYLKLDGAKFGCLSLFTDTSWETHELIFDKMHDQIKLKNWPRLSFSDVVNYASDFKTYFIDFRSQSKSDVDFLPNNSLSSKIFDDKRFVATYENLAGGERLAAFQIVGDLVATLNGYEVHLEANRKNKTREKKRNIYFNAELNKFISIDYEKGAFELLDGGGKHLGEYSFIGNHISGADDKGKHDIIL
jgi:hypothetical protein